MKYSSYNSGAMMDRQSFDHKKTASLEKESGILLEGLMIETFGKCSFLLKFKEGENFNHRNTFSISRIKI